MNERQNQILEELWQQALLPGEVGVKNQGNVFRTIADGTNAASKALNLLTLRPRQGPAGVQYFERVKENTAGVLVSDNEWMIVDPTLPPLATDAKQDGYRVTRDKNVGRMWGRQYSGPGTIPIKVIRDDYVAHQEWARERALVHRESMRALLATS